MNIVEITALVGRLKDQAERPADTAGFAPFRQGLRDAAAALEEMLAAKVQVVHVEASAPDVSVHVETIRQLRADLEQAQAASQHRYEWAMAQQARADGLLGELAEAQATMHEDERETLMGTLEGLQARLANHEAALDGALAALAGAGICTPLETFKRAPSGSLGSCIRNLVDERDQAQDAARKLLEGTAMVLPAGSLPPPDEMAAMMAREPGRVVAVDDDQADVVVELKASVEALQSQIAADQLALQQMRAERIAFETRTEKMRSVLERVLGADWEVMA